jgi:hypothetical protein
MTDDCKRLVEDYVRSLQGSFRVQETEHGCIIVTPFMRRDNDLIEIGVEPMPDGRLLLTDYGETIAFLNLSGVNVSRSPEVKRILAQTAKRFSVEIGQDDISVFVREGDLAQAFQHMVEAVNGVAHLVYKRQRRPPTAFDDKVEKILISNGYGYEPDFPVQGRTELHRFRFYLNGRYRALIDPLSATSATAALAKAERQAFRWVDINGVGADYTKLVILDNEGPRHQFWDGRPTEVLSGYSDGVVLWSAIDQLPSYIARERLT